MDNLDTLATSLPTAYQNAEKELLSDFKAAALSITTLYRSSRTASKRAYNAGYSAAYKDLLMMIQQGVSAGGITTSDSQGGMDDGMTIGRVMDWIEARLEAIRSREEEEDEDEEREKERDHARPSKAPPAPPTPTATTRPMTQATQSRPPTFSAAADNSDASTVASSPTTTLRTIPHPQPPSKGSRNRAKESTEPPTSERNPSPTLPGINHIFPDQIPTAGSKRRHAVMVMLDSAPSVANSASTLAPPGGNHSAIATRRRTRSARNLALHHNQNIMQPPEAMDVEEDGRDRKRVTRR
ncbi:hypothetical protein AB1N83_005132 [Pleurotus pulmonarius]|nr:hypothetical protein EYR38_009753 [Pleurotus pulmonarius]